MDEDSLVAENARLRRQLKSADNCINLIDQFLLYGLEVPVGMLRNEIEVYRSNLEQ